MPQAVRLQVTVLYTHARFMPCAVHLQVVERQLDALRAADFEASRYSN